MRTKLARASSKANFSVLSGQTLPTARKLRFYQPAALPSFSRSLSGAACGLSGFKFGLIVVDVVRRGLGRVFTVKLLLGLFGGQLGYLEPG